jgi:hypothetical protein
MKGGPPCVGTTTPRRNRLSTQIAALNTDLLVHRTRESISAPAGLPPRWFARPNYGEAGSLFLNIRSCHQPKADLAFIRTD